MGRWPTSLVSGLITLLFREVTSTWPKKLFKMDKQAWPQWFIFQGTLRLESFFHDFHSILVFLPLIQHWESRTSSIFSSRRPFTLHNLPVRLSLLCSAFSLSSLSLTSWLLYLWRQITSSAIKLYIKILENYETIAICTTANCKTK